MLEYGGLCACDSITELMSNTVRDAFEDGWEIIIFEGYELCEIYDGYRVEPVKEIARMSFEEFDEDTLREYEEW